MSIFVLVIIYIRGKIKESEMYFKKWFKVYSFFIVYFFVFEISNSLFIVFKF